MKRILKVLMIWALSCGVCVNSYAQKGSGQESDFGSTDESGGALIGIFYDLKQTQKGEPSSSKGKRSYNTIVGEFIDNGWDEHYLNKFYRVSKPLYASQVFIPYINAAKAPDAFGVADTVKPRHWLVHYKGQVRAKIAGKYRFMGLADDVLAAAVNGETVLVGCHRNIKLKTVWTPPEKENYVAGPCGPVIFGNWFEVDKGEIFDLDVIVGEIPGSGFGAWLMFQKEGVEYEIPKKGKDERKKHTRYPVFQLVNKELDPKRYRWGKSPMFSIADEQYFEGVQ